MMRATPECGKTVLMALLARAYADRGWQVLRCDLSGVGSNEKQFESRWLAHTGTPVHELAGMRQRLETRKQNVVILVDEIQVLFDAVSGNGPIGAFFQCMRHWRSCGEPWTYGVRVLCVGTFPSVSGGTNDAFGQPPTQEPGFRTLGLGDVRMTREEFNLFLDARARPSAHEPGTEPCLFPLLLLRCSSLPLDHSPSSYLQTARDTVETEPRPLQCDRSARLSDRPRVSEAAKRCSSRRRTYTDADSRVAHTPFQPTVAAIVLPARLHVRRKRSKQTELAVSGAFVAGAEVRSCRRHSPPKPSEQ